MQSAWGAAVIVFVMFRWCVIAYFLQHLTECEVTGFNSHHLRKATGRQPSPHHHHLSELVKVAEVSEEQHWLPGRCTLLFCQGMGRARVLTPWLEATCSCSWVSCWASGRLELVHSVLSWCRLKVSVLMFAMLFSFLVSLGQFHFEKTVLHNHVKKSSCTTNHLECLLNEVEIEIE